MKTPSPELLLPYNANANEEFAGDIPWGGRKESKTPNQTPGVIHNALNRAHGYFDRSPVANMALYGFTLLGAMCLASKSSAFAIFNDKDNKAAYWTGVGSAIVGSFFTNAGIFKTLSVTYSLKRMMEADRIINSKSGFTRCFYLSVRLLLWANFFIGIAVQAKLTGESPPTWLIEWDGWSDVFSAAGGAGVIMSRLHATANAIIWLDGSERKPFKENFSDIQNTLNFLLILGFMVCNIWTWLYMYNLKCLDVLDLSFSYARILGAALTIINPITFYFTAADVLHHFIRFLDYSNTFLIGYGAPPTCAKGLIGLEIILMAYFGFCSISGLTDSTSRQEAPYVTTAITMLFVNITSLTKVSERYKKDSEKGSVASLPSGLRSPAPTPTRLSVQSDDDFSASAPRESKCGLLSALRSCFSFLCGSKPAQTVKVNGKVNGAAHARTPLLL